MKEAKEAKGEKRKLKTENNQILKTFAQKLSYATAWHVSKVRPVEACSESFPCESWDASNVWKAKKNKKHKKQQKENNTNGMLNALALKYALSWLYCCSRCLRIWFDCDSARLHCSRKCRKSRKSRVLNNWISQPEPRCRIILDYIFKTAAGITASLIPPSTGFRLSSQLVIVIISSALISRLPKVPGISDGAA